MAKGQATRERGSQERVYRGVSAEDRRADRRRRLMDAGLDLIGTQGLASTTFRAVCERARVGPRFFYESFPDVEALATAVYDEIIERSLADALAAIRSASDDTPARIRAATEVLLAALTDDPRVARLVFAESYASHRLTQRRFEAMRELTEMSVEQSHEMLSLPPGSDAVVHAMSRLITGGVAELVMAWLDGGEQITREALTELCVEHVVHTVGHLPALIDVVRAPAEG